MLSRRSFLNGATSALALASFPGNSFAAQEVVDLSQFQTLQAGINSVSGAPAKFYLPAGTYSINAPLIISNPGQSIYGDGQLASIISCTDPNQDGIYVSNPNASDKHLHGFNLFDIGFTSPVTKTGGAYVHLNLAQTINLGRISMTNPYYGFQLTDTTILTLDGFDIINPVSNNGIGIKIDGVNDSNDQYISNGIIRDYNPSGQKSRCAVQIENSAYTSLDTIDGYQTGIGLILMAAGPPPATMGPRANVEMVWTKKCAWDTCDSHGMLAVTGPGGMIRRYRSNEDWFASNRGSGFAMAGPGLLEGFDFIQAQVHSNGLHGFDIENGGDVNITSSRIGGNGWAAANTYHGVSVWPNISHVRIRDNIIGPNNEFPDTQAYGVYIGTGCDNYMVASNDLQGNTLGRYLDAANGPHKQIFGNLT